ncbi:hypothetical protein IW140_004442 [Coemansia sp. RSA 1813]|nr:hypothetical protein EV178_004535 [Coemansia sp. RSA 1646]KAJ1765489.1 hypothetical protein LPJ74_006323 [Coemansia sp. RSA 1843]KAJ2087839.1 hypothetical protein IW138_004636 [Coemansia sp. RSA 986]KAJ2212731.1 hypothetical protein EV179_004384 [Coemansia sp. RSA 487]KAJ2567470.1 hypothetical protein IW140_004442 [Coemansia sp. RSA 1813]
MSNALSESVAKQLANDVRTLFDENDIKTSSTYIPSYSAEFLNDTANSHRILQAFGGDMRRAAVSLARTMEWRQMNKIYPARKHIGSSELVVDPQGLVVMHARTQALVQLSDAVERECQCDCGGNQPESQRRRKRKTQTQHIARVLSTLEDVRIALKSVGAGHGLDMHAAVVVPVETVSLGNICTHDILKIVDIAWTHYGAAVQRVYITATSSVLLEHARQGLQPVLSKVLHEYADRIEFVMADALSAQCIGIGEFACRAAAVLPDTPSVCCTDTDDDFCSAYSQALQPQDESGSSHLTRHQSLAKLAPLLPTSLTAAVFPQAHKQSEIHKYPIAQRRNSNSSNSSIGGSHHSSESNAVTPIQLASLQRAVQGVQRMLGSLNDTIVGAESRAALAATRSKLVQQADVLMSTVAALNFGVSATDDTGVRVPSYFERRGSSSSSSSGAGSPLPADDDNNTTGRHGVLGTRTSNTYLVEAAQTHSQGTSGLLRVLLLQLAALPVSLLLGKTSRSSSLSALLVRIVRRTIRTLRAMPAMHSLLLLAYKHFRIYAMIIWTAAMLVWQANAAMIWSNLTAQWKRGIAY